MDKIVYEDEWNLTELNRFVKTNVGNVVFVNHLPSLNGACKHIDIGIVKEDKSSDKIVFRSLDFMAKIPFTYDGIRVVFYIDREGISKQIDESLGVMK